MFSIAPSGMPAVFVSRLFQRVGGDEEGKIPSSFSNEMSHNFQTSINQGVGEGQGVGRGGKEEMTGSPYRTFQNHRKPGTPEALTSPSISSHVETRRLGEKWASCPKFRVCPFI